MINKELNKLLETFITMASVENSDELVEKIINVVMDITNCDGGTLYILKGGKLQFKFMRTKSLNIKKRNDDEKINLPDVEMKKSNVCAYSVLEKKLVNIPDVNKSELFDFSGPKNYDKITNYKTQSMIVVPMVDDKGRILGVMQLLNAQDENGNIVNFTEKHERIVSAIASQAAIKLTNINYTIEIKELMENIVKTFAEVIYLRTPYNVTHTAHMQIYAERFIKWLAANKNEILSISDEQAQLFYMSIWLHDIGKVAIPLRVMDKATRLSTKIERVNTRLDIIKLTTMLNCTKKACDYTQAINEIEQTRKFIEHVNTMPFLNDETLAKVQGLKEKVYEDEHGNLRPWFSEDEIEDLSIVKGTLTQKEREIIQTHVVMTEQILAKMQFKNEYENVPVWAANHHEFLNGTGYPKKLVADKLDNFTQLLTIIDVFDGLSAIDRPYKKPTPIDKVFKIMQEMVSEGKLNGNILNLFKKSKAWEKQ